LIATLNVENPIRNGTKQKKNSTKKWSFKSIHIQKKKKILKKQDEIFSLAINQSRIRFDTKMHQSRKIIRLELLAKIKVQIVRKQYKTNYRNSQNHSSNNPKVYSFFMPICFFSVAFHNKDGIILIMVSLRSLFSLFYCCFFLLLFLIKQGLMRFWSFSHLFK
jgi:hypothetical protein